MTFFRPNTPEEQTSHSPRHTWRVFFLLLLIAVLAAGCFDKRPVSTTIPRAGAPRKAALMADAEWAWKSGNTIRSEILYRRLLELKELTPGESGAAWERFTRSALANRHYHLAMEALARWEKTVPQASQSEAWGDTLIQVVKAIGSSTDTEKQLRNIVADAKIPPSLRTRAGLILADWRWRAGERGPALAELANLYAGLDSSRHKAGMERELAREIQNLDTETLDELALGAPEVESPPFPFTILALEQARRLAATDGAWPLAWHIFRRLMQEKQMAAPELVRSLLGSLEAEKGQPIQGLALALPLTGPFSSVGWKVLRGAGVAQWELAQTGMNLTVEVVNTDSPDWVARIAKLPSSLSLVGGPLRVQAFKQAAAGGLTADRAFFAFLPGLGEAEEGRNAWRFFPSPKDQINILLDNMTLEYGIYSPSVFYPEEPFGVRMSQLFHEEAALRGIEIPANATAAYPPKKPQAWGKSIARLLGVEKNPDDEDPMPPKPEFQAVFLPDGWSQAQMAVPHFFFYQEDRLLFMGSSLWGQGLSKKEEIDTQYFRLAIFPGAWWDKNDTPAAVSLRNSLQAEGLEEPDFWTGLGYDFVRFASAVGSLPTGWNPESLNKRIQTAMSMDWSIAPISWDPNGIASEELFLFRPTSKGMTPVQPELIRGRLDQAKRLHERRIQSLLDKKEAKLEAEKLKKMESQEIIKMLKESDP